MNYNSLPAPRWWFPLLMATSLRTKRVSLPCLRALLSLTVRLSPSPSKFWFKQFIQQFLCLMPLFRFWDFFCRGSPTQRLIAHWELLPHKWGLVPPHTKVCTILSHVTCHFLLSLAAFDVCEFLVSLHDDHLCGSLTWPKWKGSLPGQAEDYTLVIKMITFGNRRGFHVRVTAN